MAKVKEVKEPRFSVNKLGEYMGAKASRRRKLIHDQKYPSPFMTSRYRVAREAIVKFFISGYDETIITQAIDEIRVSALKDEEKDNSILALEEILKTDLPDLDGVTIQRYNPRKKPKLTVKGLDVSVNPDLVLMKDDKVGCLKVHIIKTVSSRLNNEAQKLVGTMLTNFTDLYLTEEDTPPFKNYCISVDCFGNSYEVAPKSDSRRWADIEAACEEIALRWESI